MTREEMAIMLVRAYEHLTSETLPVDLDLAYKDDNHIGATVLPYVTVMTQAVVLEGTGRGHFPSLIGSCIGVTETTAINEGK